MKKCIFNDKKTCNNCGECDSCVFDKNKICDNCGKCLEMEGYDVRAIKIDEVFEKNNTTKEKPEINLEDFSDFDLSDDIEDSQEDDFDDNHEEDEELPYIDAMDNEDNWMYLDDVEGINEALEDPDHHKDDMEEKYPGLYIYRK